MTTPEPSSAAIGMHPGSDLWIDQPQAETRIRALRERDELSAEQADGLLHFADNGYLVFSPGFDDQALDAVNAGVDRLWREKPADLAYACDSPARSMALAEVGERRARYRIHDLHSHVPAALDLYLQPRIFEYARQILGDDAVAIQSLYFEYGSEQILHRDPVVVPTGAPGHLLAAWIALEDISADSGALVYVPGSHRLPYYTFSPGEYMFDGSRMGEEEIRAGTAWDDEQARRRGLEPKIFTARKGEVLLWHASLRHGGSPVRDPSLTRRSFVVHYAPRRSYLSRSITVVDLVRQDGRVEERARIMETETVIERDGSAGFDNPMRGRERV